MFHVEGFGFGVRRLGFRAAASLGCLRFVVVRTEFQLAQGEKTTVFARYPYDGNF